MSSYLNIYLQEKDSKKKILLRSYSRSSDFYQTINEEINPTFIGIDENEEDKYTELTSENLSSVLNVLDKDISKQQQHLMYMEKAVSSNVDIINEILEKKDYIDKLVDIKNEITFYKELADDMKLKITGFDGIFCNID